MRIEARTKIAKTLFGLAALMMVVPSVLIATPPDLTAPGVIATINRGNTFNLGATGLRGWICEDNSGKDGFSKDMEGLHTAESRQILITLVSTPATTLLAVDDVILGARAGRSGPVPLFTCDVRKAMGLAIGEAESTGAGSLRVKRWRAGSIADVNIPIAIMGDYAETAPYRCSKSAKILANARAKLVSQLIADPKFLKFDYGGAINGLALLAGVVPGDPDYDTVQARLQSFARECATSIRSYAYPTWHVGYIGLFLSEYYLCTGDAEVVSGLNNYIVTLAKMQSKYGTYGHGGAELKADGSLHGAVLAYGSINQPSIPANIAIVLGKKALLAAGQPLDPEIAPAIHRGSQFYAWFVNKGGMPYGEHEPNFNNHASNGKDAACAVLFGIQADRTVETEFFSRLAIAGFNGRESGHAGHGFSFVWGALGANMGGEVAVAAYMKQLRWQHDLLRRTDGSFVYNSDRIGVTADGTYLGESRSYDFSSTGIYLLAHSLPLKRLYITGKNSSPANTLDAAKVANAIASATFRQECPSFTTARVIVALKEYDPIVRTAAIRELSKRSLSAEELATLRNMISGTHANGRMAACETLGLLKDTLALPLIVQRLDKTSETNTWVRTMASRALLNYDPALVSTYLHQMLKAIAANAIDLEVMNWDDPYQYANNYLANIVFYDGTLKTKTKNAPKNLLLPALKTELRNPDGHPRRAAAYFCNDFLTFQDVTVLLPEIIDVAAEFCDANTMSSLWPRTFAIQTLAKWKIREGIPVALGMLKPPYGWHGEIFTDAALNTLASYGDAARWTLPTLKGYVIPGVPNKLLDSTIETLENATTAPILVAGFAVASNQVVVTTGGTTAITLAGSSCRDTVVTFLNVSSPSHGKIIGTPPNLTYTPASGYTGLDSFTFQTHDAITMSGTGTVSLIVGAKGAGSGLKGDYFDRSNFTDLKLTRTDAQVDFNWGPHAPDASLSAGPFSVRWTGALLVPETRYYIFSTLTSDYVRLSVNGVTVIDSCANHAPRWKDGIPIYLTAGQRVDLCLEYCGKSGSARAKLKWIGPSFAGPNGSIISKEWMFDGTGVARAPYAYAQTVPVMKNTPQKIMLQGRGVISAPLTTKILTLPTRGTLTGTAPNVIYTPSANYTGTDSFTFTVSNGLSNSPPATITLALTQATNGNGVPVAISQRVIIPSNKRATITLVGSDWEDSVLTYTIVTPPAHGTLSNTPPRVTYSPSFNYTGPDSFTFKVNDSTFDSPLATVAIMVPVGLTATVTSEPVKGSPHTGPLIQATKGDLLEAALASITESAAAESRHLASSVYDGQIVPGWGPAGRWGHDTAGKHFIEFNLNTTVYAQGYDISTIKVTQGADNFRPKQAWKVSFKRVGSNSFTDFFTLPPSGVSNQVNQVVLADVTPALLASRVSALRFDFGDSGQGHGWTCYSEIDVIGKPAQPGW